MPVGFRIKTTVTIPPEWVEPLLEYKKKEGFQDWAELIRHLIKVTIIQDQEPAEEVVAA